MLQECIVYWIHSSEETDIKTQGYVGITKDLERRIREHSRKLDLIDNRVVDIYLCGELSYCKEVEKTLRPHRNIGLNISEGGGMPPDATGIRRSVETKEKMKANMVGFRGRKHTEESRRKMRSHKRIGKKHTEETKKKLSEIAKKRTFNGMSGRTHSEETKQKMREKALAREKK
jgi:hypothetical protein